MYPGSAPSPVPAHADLKAPRKHGTELAGQTPHESGIAAELLSERVRERVLPAGAAELDDVPEGISLRGEDVAGHLDAFNDAVELRRYGKVRGGRNGVVRRLGLVHMGVRVHGVLTLRPVRISLAALPITSFTFMLTQV